VWCLATRLAPAQDTTESSRLTIEINLPAFRLDARIDSVTVATFPVAVGMRRYPTPLGDFSITEVQWNPWWRPPDSWWARNDSITPPGPGNPMGKVKMALGSRLYVHGTPQSRSIGTAASHACIRLRNGDAVALAQLVQQYVGASISAEKMRVILARWSTTHTIPLPSPIAVHIVYRLVELRSDELQFHADIYRQGRTGVESEALALLSSAGHDTTAVDRELLRRVAEQAARSPSTVKVAQLIPPR
jgi:murein L,D-transpeptidase YcbB/YkuD